LAEQKISITSINGHGSNEVPDPEVVSETRGRRFRAEYKQRILAEVDQCQEAGAIGAILRREGLYSSHLTTWRRQRVQGQLAGLSPKKRGRKPDPQAAELARLQRENERLKARLQQAETIIEVQKKVSQLLGLAPIETDGSD
jgi:transposase-like protein